MESQSVQLVQISLPDFAKFIQETVSTEVQKLAAYFAPTQNENRDELLTRDEVRKLLKTSFTTLWKLDKEGILTCRRVGRRVYYLKQDVLDVLDSGHDLAA